MLKKRQDFKIRAITMTIVDHYSLSSVWEEHIKPFTDTIMAIDDIANRKHHCDILIDPIGILRCIIDIQVNF